MSRLPVLICSEIFQKFRTEDFASSATWVTLFVSFFCQHSSASSNPPEPISSFTQKYCIQCHGEKQQKGDFRIDTLSWDLVDTASYEQWELVHEYVADGDMPPNKANAHPGAGESKAFLSSLDKAFEQAAKDASPGGTPLRRLNQVEYLNTVRDLFGIRMIQLPLSFPADATQAEFDTMPEGLFLSPAVMEAYHETATDLANRIVPLPNPPTYSSSLTTKTIGGDQGRRWFGPKGEYLKFTGFNHSGWVGALWDSQFIAPASGVYRVKLLANAQASKGADGKPLRLAFYAFDLNEEQLPKRYRTDRATMVAEFDIPNGPPQWVDCDVPLEAGETFHIYCANRLPDDAYVVGDQNRSQINKELAKLKKRNEPTVELRAMKLDGPVAVPPRVVEFFGTWPPKADRASLEAQLHPLAEKVFRRPLVKAESEKLISAVLKHAKQTGSPTYAWHYAIRRLLCSPEFLYREAEDSIRLSPYALASRLSYFLWSTLPDDELLQAAASGKLADPKVLQAQVRRMIRDPRSAQFIKHFTGQWLGNRTVKAINVCDNRYTWDDNVRYGFIRSSEMFFEEILQEDLAISTFIDSDFTYANTAMQTVWGIKGVEKLAQVAARQRQSLVWPEPTRIDFTQPSQSLPKHVLHRGGILGLPGVLTVTGDGVESSPILRGVWVLENLFGQHPPPPPKDVPALDIDTSQATNVRETLKLHTELPTCAKCHRDIDPLGLALENYDAIGGWRTNYPSSKDTIDVSSTLPTGHKLDGAASIKTYLLDNPSIFTRCLLTKLLEYGAGRKLSVGDQRVVDGIVNSEPSAGYKFQELIVKAVSSEVFLSK